MSTMNDLSTHLLLLVSGEKLQALGFVSNNGQIHTPTSRPTTQRSWRWILKAV